MPDDRVKISALDSASTMETGDMFPVTQERGGVLSTKKATMTQLASEVVNGIEYTTALDTDDKKPIGAINELLDRLIALLPVVSFSATPIATLTDGAENVPMKSLVVDIVPKQASGTPTPSSPLPITGFTGANVTHTGKNLVFSNIDATVDASGVVISSSNYYKFCIAKVAQGQTYTVTTSDTSLVCGFFYNIPEVGDTTYNGSRIVDTQSKTFVAPITGYVGFRAIYAGDYQCEAGTTATTYEPYTATTYPISWQTEAGTVYGGWYDVTTGKLTVTHGIVDMGSLSWTYSTLYKWFYTYVLDILSGSLDILSTIYVVKPVAEISGDLTVDDAITVNGTSIVVRNLDYTDANTFKTAMSGVMLVYPLATPIEYTLTPTTIKTRGGTESIYSDTGDVSGEYRADIQAYIDGLANNGGNRSLNSLNLSKGAIEEEPEKEEVKEEEPKEEEKK